MDGIETWKEIQIYRKKDRHMVAVNDISLNRTVQHLQASLLCAENISSYLISSHEMSSEPFQSNSSLHLFQFLCCEEL